MASSYSNNLSKLVALYKASPKREDAIRFLNNLVLFLRMRRETHVLSLVPLVAGKMLDLHTLYVEVLRRGGFKAVVQSAKWNEIAGAHALNVPPTAMRSAAYLLRFHYRRILYAYEQKAHFNVDVPVSKPPPLTSSSTEFPKVHSGRYREPPPGFASFRALVQYIMHLDDDADPTILAHALGLRVFSRLGEDAATRRARVIKRLPLNLDQEQDIELLVDCLDAPDPLLARWATHALLVTSFAHRGMNVIGSEDVTRDEEMGRRKRQTLASVLQKSVTDFEDMRRERAGAQAAAAAAAAAARKARSRPTTPTPASSGLATPRGDATVQTASLRDRLLNSLARMLVRGLTWTERCLTTTDARKEAEAEAVERQSQARLLRRSSSSSASTSSSAASSLLIKATQQHGLARGSSKAAKGGPKGVGEGSADGPSAGTGLRITCPAVRAVRLQARSVMHPVTPVYSAESSPQSGAAAKARREAEAAAEADPKGSGSGAGRTLLRPVMRRMESEHLRAEFKVGQVVEAKQTSSGEWHAARVVGVRRAFGADDMASSGSGLSAADYRFDVLFFPPVGERQDLTPAQHLREVALGTNGRSPRSAGFVATTPRGSVASPRTAAAALLVRRRFGPRGVDGLPQRKVAMLERAPVMIRAVSEAHMLRVLTIIANLALEPSLQIALVRHAPLVTALCQSVDATRPEVVLAALQALSHLSRQIDASGAMLDGAELMSKGSMFLVRLDASGQMIKTAANLEVEKMMNSSRGRTGRSARGRGGKGRGWGGRWGLKKKMKKKRSQRSTSSSKPAKKMRVGSRRSSRQHSIQIAHEAESNAAALAAANAAKQAALERANRLKVVPLNVHATPNLHGMLQYEPPAEAEPSPMKMDVDADSASVSAQENGEEANAVTKPEPGTALANLGGRAVLVQERLLPQKMTAKDDAADAEQGDGSDALWPEFRRRAKNIPPVELPRPLASTVYAAVSSDARPASGGAVVAAGSSSASSSRQRATKHSAAATREAWMVQARRSLSRMLSRLFLLLEHQPSPASHNSSGYGRHFSRSATLSRQLRLLAAKTIGRIAGHSSAANRDVFEQHVSERGIEALLAMLTARRDGYGLAMMAHSIITMTPPEEASVTWQICSETAKKRQKAKKSAAAAAAAVSNSGSGSGNANASPGAAGSGPVRIIGDDPTNYAISLGVRLMCKQWSRKERDEAVGEAMHGLDVQMRDAALVALHTLADLQGDRLKVLICRCHGGVILDTLVNIIRLNACRSTDSVDVNAYLGMFEAPRIAASLIANLSLPEANARFFGPKVEQGLLLAASTDATLTPMLSLILRDMYASTKRAS